METATGITIDDFNKRLVDALVEKVLCKGIPERVAIEIAKDSWLTDLGVGTPCRRTEIEVEKTWANTLLKRYHKNE